ncbi:MAG: O-antigen ligase family protein [Ruminococcus sp.]|nr:O-antigen ligase family protein [Ruminococcus sp.]
MAKQLFNSSEKSNFILNMTEEKYSELAAYGLIAACLAPSLFALIPEFAKKLSFTVVTGGISIAGVICMVLALISAMKKYVTKKILFHVCTFGFIVVWSVLSLINSFDVNISLYGFPGRGEGVLAFVFYFSFFVTGASVRRSGTASKFINALIVSGLLSSAVALVQIFTGKLSHYRFLYLDIEANAASGLAQSPIFLAMLLSVCLIAAETGFIMSQSKKRRIFCLVSICVFSFVMMFTYSLLGICGLVTAVITGIITVIKTKAPKIRLLSAAAVAVPAAAAVLLVYAGAIGTISSYRLYDGYSLWWADSYMRLSASGDNDLERLDLSSTKDVYLYLNDKTVNIIGKYPILGTGPDQLVFPQLYTYGTLDEQSNIDDIISQNRGAFDKVYNEYLYTAATRGIPSLIALLLLLISVIVTGCKKLRKKADENDVCLMSVIVCGSLLFMIGVSNITFSPIFWAAAGLLISRESEDVSNS